MAVMRFSSVRGTGLVPGASRRGVASNDVPAAQVSNHVGVASALAGTMPLLRAKYPPTRATTMVANAPNTNPLKSVDRLLGTPVPYAYAIKAGPWIFLTGHEAYDWETGTSDEVTGPPGFPL